MSLLDTFRAIVGGDDSVMKENANMNAQTPSGMMMKFASEASKEYGRESLLNRDSRDLVNANLIHIHDFDYYPTQSLTCVQHPLNKILGGGFIAGHGESRPAKHIETAGMLTAISLETAQNEMHKQHCA